MIDAIVSVWRQAHSADGGFLVRRYISFMGHIVAMVIMMKLTWMSGMTEGYFTVYTAFIAGHATLDKLVARGGKSKPEAE